MYRFLVATTNDDSVGSPRTASDCLTDFMLGITLFGALRPSSALLWPWHKSMAHQPLITSSLVLRLRLPGPACRKHCETETWVREWVAIYYGLGDVLHESTTIYGLQNILNEIDS